MARTVKRDADAAEAQIPVARAALKDTRAATDKARAAMLKAVDASSDADKAKARAEQARTAAETEAASAAKARAEAEAASKSGECAAAQAAAAAAARASAAAQAAADTAAASLQAVKSDALTADRAKAEALDATHRSHAAAARVGAAYTAADKAAIHASDAVASAYGKAMTMSDVGKTTSDGTVAVTDANYRLFQDAVASAQSANDSASTVNLIRQEAINSYDEADRDTQTAYNAAKHIQAVAGDVIDAKNAAARAARKAADDALAAKKAADACKPKVVDPQPPEGPSPPPPAKFEVRYYPTYTHRQTSCAACQELAKALNAAIDDYNPLSAGPSGAPSPAKDAALAKIQTLSAELTACEGKCVGAVAVPARFELGLGYCYMHPADEAVKSLNGFTLSGFYPVSSCLAVGGEFSGLYGTMTQQFAGGELKNSLNRYLYLFGPQVTLLPSGPVRVFGRVLVGAVHDGNEVTFRGGSTRFSANAFALALGASAEMPVTARVSVGASFDYAPTHFTNWQHNWRLGLAGKIRF